MSETNIPVFILGPARSGTTLLRVLLDSHPSLAGIDELNFSTPLIEAFLSCIEKRALHEDLGFPPFEEVRSRFEALHRFPRDSIAKLRKKKRWVDSTHTSNERYIDVIDELYDGECQYLISIRHPADVLVSQIERFGGTLEHYAARIASVGAVQAEMIEQVPERCHCVRYEELVSRPSEVMADVWTFLREPQCAITTDLLLENPVRSGDDKIRQTKTIHTQSINRWSAALRSDQIDYLRNHTGFAKYASRWGYSVQVTAGMQAM